MLYILSLPSTRVGFGFAVFSAFIAGVGWAGKKTGELSLVSDGFLRLFQKINASFLKNKLREVQNSTCADEEIFLQSFILLRPN